MNDCGSLRERLFRGASWMRPVIIQSSVSLVSEKDGPYFPKMLSMTAFLCSRKRSPELYTEERRLQWGRRWLKENSATFIKRESSQLRFGREEARFSPGPSSDLFPDVECFVVVSEKPLAHGEDEKVLWGNVCKFCFLVNLEGMLWLWLSSESAFVRRLRFCLIKS